MNDIEEIYFKMFVCVEGTLFKFKPVWLGNQNIMECYDSLVLTNKKLKKFSVTKLDNPKGLTKGKGVLRSTLTQEAYAIKQALVLYYQSKGLTEEIELISFSISDLKHLTEDAFINTVADISEQATPLAVFLFPHWITQVMIDKLAADVVSFRKLIKQLKLAIKKQSSLLKFTTKEIKDCRLMLRNRLDIAISIFKENNKDFVVNYFLARRRLKKPGKHRTYKVTISGKVIDSINKEGLMNVKVDAGAKNILTTTDIKGCYEIKIFKKDANEIRFSLLEKYKEISVAIPKKFVKNKVEINVELVKEQGSDIAKEQVDIIPPVNPIIIPKINPVKEI
ncbi:MAG: carboxypeptidase-like regulatory domain-containing protein [Bacteroidota bacterium]